MLDLWLIYHHLAVEERYKWKWRIQAKKNPRISGKLSFQWKQKHNIIFWKNEQYKNMQLSFLIHWKNRQAVLWE